MKETELATGYILGLEQDGILRGAPRVLREELFTNQGVRTVPQRALHAQRPGTTTGPAAVWNRNGHKRVRGPHWAVPPFIDTIHGGHWKMPWSKGSYIAPKPRLWAVG